MLLEGKTAVVTGIGPGMGRDIALSLAREGADVALVARSDKTVPAVAAEIEAMGRRAVPVYANIADADECARMASEVEAAFGGSLDILVNSAFYGGLDERFEDADLDKWQRPIKVNYLGTLRVTQALLPQLKAALGAVSKTLALELGEYGIRVNSVHPGYIWGDSVQIYFQWQADERGGDTTWETIYEERAAETALGYLPHSSEIAGAVVFFASPLAKCVTGTALPVNSGHWMPPSA